MSISMAYQWHAADPKQRGFPNNRSGLFRNLSTNLLWSVKMLGSAAILSSGKKKTAFFFPTLRVSRLNSAR